MAEKPILFSAPMIRALLSGTKTQTRRVLKPQPVQSGDRLSIEYSGMRHGGPIDFMLDIMAKYGTRIRAGDELWVRETFALVGTVDPGWLLYRASGYEDECRRHGFENPPPETEVKWKPSIFMPRWASRITLKVTAVKVEKLGAISVADARAEGVSSVEEFVELWKTINGKWEPETLVAAMEFQKVSP